MRNMIVIATHNGRKHLIGLLSDVKSFNMNNEDICIVDNGSNDQLHLNYLKELSDDGLNVLYNPESRYEVGGFKTALDHFKSDIWFCVQDSVRLKQNIFEMVIPKLTDKNVYTFLTFQKFIHDAPYYKDYLIKHFNTYNYSKGIFGCNIFAKDSVLQLVKNEWALPIHKHESESMERGLSIVFDKHNIEIVGMDELDTSGRLFKGEDLYPFFKKTFAGRR